MEDLKLALKKMVIQECRVRGVLAEQILDSDPVIGGTGLVQLDSLDAVEIVTCLERNFDLKSEGLPLKNMFRSYEELSQYIHHHVHEEKVLSFCAKHK